MPKVFISHSTFDREFVEREIISFLEAHQIETWYSKNNIQSSEQWERSILQGLKSCDSFLVVMSPHSAQSTWVKREVDWVFNKGGKTIIPVLIQDCDSDDFHIGMAGIHYVDFRQNLELGRKSLLQIWGIKGKPQKINDEFVLDMEETDTNDEESSDVVLLEEDPKPKIKSSSISPISSGGTFELTEANWELEVVQSKVPVLVHFWATWCGPCRMLKPTLNKLEAQFAGKVKIGQLDVDKESKIAVKYGITTIPRLLIFRGGESPRVTLIGVQAEKEILLAIQKVMGQ